MAPSLQRCEWAHKGQGNKIPYPESRFLSYACPDFYSKDSLAEVVQLKQTPVRAFQFTLYMSS